MREYYKMSLHPVVDPRTDEVLAEAGVEFTEELVKKVESTAINSLEVRSPLTCEAEKICAKCYGRNLSTGKWFK